MIITTNNHARHLRFRYEVPPKVLAEQFEHITDETDGFFCYRGVWYHLSDFMVSPIEGWDGYTSDSFFSGVLVKLTDDYESVICATYIS